MHLLYITFGNEKSIHLQAAFSIVTFARQKGIKTINIITDAPEFYRHLQQLVTIIKIDEALLNEWKGPHSFFWRIKLKGIQKIANQYPAQPVMYLDTDTFLFKDMEGLQSKLKNGAGLMHENEGPLNKKKSKTERKMWAQIAGKSFGAIEIKSGMAMWNAGVVAIPNTKNGAECDLTLNICDAMCAAGVTPRLIEQFALSLALENIYGLQPAKEIVHYWSAKEQWNKQISLFFAGAFFEQLTTEEVLKKISDFDFKNVVIQKRSSNSAGRLHQLIDRFFKKIS
jgi:hypothetical protein